MNDLIKKIITFLFIIVFFLVNVVIIFSSKVLYRTRILFLLDNKLLLLFAFFVFLFIFNFINKKSNKVKETKLIIFSTFFLFVFEVIISNLCLFRPSWDAGLLLNFSYDNVFPKLRLSAGKFYFNSYPNNVVLLLYEMVIASFTKFLGQNFEFYNLLLVIINCVIFSVVGIMLYYMSKKITNNKKISFLGWIIYFILVGSSSWFMVPYSDTVGLLFPSLIMFIYIYFNKNIYLKVFLISFLSFLGFQIKPQLVICFIAITIIGVINLIFQKKYRSTFKYCVIVLFSFLLVNIPVNYLKNDIMKLDKNKRLGVTHFLMMGSNFDFNGLYNNNDVHFSMTILNKKERERKNLEVFKNRMIEYGFSNILIHIRNKTLTNFNDGTFYFGYEGVFYEDAYKRFNSNISKDIKEFCYSTGEYYIYLATIRQAAWLLVLFLMLFSRSKKYKSNILVLQMSLLGLFLFETLFEARSRYLFTYVPFFILLAMYGFNCLYKKYQYKIYK